ncbi:MAG: histidinol-phosphatase [Alphaproteobacteria bacterium]|nr:histidinol-phosphatase [Alphaproteobacteria bacterium]MDY4689777.1 histidinol-phosphatase [Alphaproteobacteria bacterium]
MTVQNFSYHSHTNFSDGNNTLEEMVAQAKKLGFCELGISDHLCVHKNIKQSKSWPLWEKRGNSHIFKNDFETILPDFQKHCEYIRKISHKSGIKLYVGFEVDYFTYDGWFSELQDFLSKLDYDYVITGNHMLFDEKCENIIDLYDLPAFYDDETLQNELLLRHFKTIEMAVKSGVFKFLAHLDYARKLGEICSADKFIPQKIHILDALKNKNMGMEISTKGLRKINDFYPSDEILTEAAKRSIPFVISDDAHAVAELGDRFDLAEAALAKHNIQHRIKF